MQHPQKIKPQQLGICFKKDIQDKFLGNCYSKSLCFGKMQTAHYHMGGISEGPNSTPLAPSTSENKESAKGFRSNAVVSFAGYGFVSKHSAVQPSSSCAGRDGLGNLPLFMGHGSKLCSAAVRSPWPRCMSSSDEVSVWQERLKQRQASAEQK